MFCPAIAQFLASNLIFATIDDSLLNLLRNTMTFRLFQIFQEMSMMSELMAFLWVSAVPNTPHHQYLTESRALQEAGGNGGKPKPILDKTPNTNGVAASEEKVGCRLQHLIAKLAHPTIRPTPPLKPVRSSLCMINCFHSFYCELCTALCAATLASPGVKES